ncbi:hypothetical protein NEOLEDRAFT_919345 [Neolentinus lepideus HHB14362 ss-1]|uniref:WW domain-containing protein n=1 Tax=Neolentinus lepideus HHB14362 ss-1 TaxID=1314782 RepID=A0A165UMK5_9AGAM|nr:hypothetical protein NEOLEDRAFT_919345 [Neolentinus lepideus HHB14362 ss-1]
MQVGSRANWIARLRRLIKQIRSLPLSWFCAVRRLVLCVLRLKPSICGSQKKNQSSSPFDKDNVREEHLQEGMQSRFLATSHEAPVVLGSTVPTFLMNTLPSPEPTPNDSRSVLFKEFGKGDDRADNERAVTPSQTAPILKPINPQDILRYDRKNKIPKAKEQSYKVPVRDQDTRRQGFTDVPAGWELCVHPEGAQYFHHPTKKIFTEADLRDSKTEEFILSSLQELERKKSQVQLHTDPADTELVLERLEETMDNGTIGVICGYYFADTRDKTLFWLEEYDATSMLSDMVAQVTEQHMQLELEARFWYHYEIFPNHRHYSEELVRELMGILLHASIDTMTSEESTSPYKWQEMQNMMSFIERAKDIGECQGYVACAISRLMGTFVHTRFLHLWGTRNVRLSRRERLYDEPERDRGLLTLFRMIYLILFYAPGKYVDALEDLSVDGIIDLHLWTDFIERLQAEWSELLLISVDIPSRVPGHTGAAQVAIYLSTVASVGSIIIGLLLIRQHRTVSRSNAHQYLDYKYDSSYGYVSLAVLYSVPYALLMWHGHIFDCIVFHLFLRWLYCSFQSSWSRPSFSTGLGLCPRSNSGIPPHQLGSNRPSSSPVSRRSLVPH